MKPVDAAEESYDAKGQKEIRSRALTLNASLSFLGKFWGLSAWMLELIMVLSAVLRKYTDLAVVSSLLVVNAQQDPHDGRWKKGTGGKSNR